MAEISQQRIVLPGARLRPQKKAKLDASGGRSIMPGYTEKSRRYLRLAGEHTHRAEAALSPRSKLTYLQLANQYRGLAEQIDDPTQWRVRHVADKRQKPVNAD
jgi:hypothetical protein